MSARRARWARRAALVLGLALAAVALAPPGAWAASDIWGNVGPASPLGSGGLWGRYPLGNYALDQHFDAVSASLTGGVDASGVAPMIAYFLASVLWALTSFLASMLISLFAFAFSLDLLNGSRATGGAGALAPVSRAIHSIYATTFGGPWLALAVAVAGIWAMWKALVQRRYTETAGALGLSLVYVVIALFFVAQPAKTIGTASQWTNKMSVAFLSVAGHGASGGERAKDGAAQQLFDLLVFKPWVVMQFGGTEHCVRAGTGSEDTDPDSLAVRPLAAGSTREAALARQLASGTEVAAGGKACINNANKYAARFLRHGLGTEERDAEYDALNHGDTSKLPAGERRGYRLGLADKPATDAMEEGGQYQRLLVAIVVFGGELGAFCLLGALSVGVILAQILLLVLLAFAPVALVAAAIPGRGHAFFKGWIEKLAGFLLRKAAYSLALAVLLAVNGALASATSQLGWLMSFGLQALFFWAVFLQRRALTEGLVGIVTGPGAPAREASLRVVGLYYGARLAGRSLRTAGQAAVSTAALPARLLRGIAGMGRSGAGSPAGAPRHAPRFGAAYSRPVGGGVPPVGAPRPAGRTRRSQGTSRGSGKNTPPTGSTRGKADGSGKPTAAEAKRPPGATPFPERAGERPAEPTDGRRAPRKPRTGQAAPGENPKARAARPPRKERSQGGDGRSAPAEPLGRDEGSGGEPDLGDELRAERERNERARGDKGGEEQKPPASRRRKRRKGKRK